MLALCAIPLCWCVQKSKKQNFECNPLVGGGNAYEISMTRDKPYAM